MSRSFEGMLYKGGGSMTAPAVRVHRTRRILSTLEQIEAYQLPALVDRLEKKLNLTRAAAQQLFEDTKKFLYLAALHVEPVAPSAEIDEGWHAFILFTREYEQFCKQYFGFFVHHAPTVSGHTTRALHARLLAEQIFGDNLSSNWGVIAADCKDDCTPTTNCETPPTDCATNHCNSSG